MIVQPGALTPALLDLMEHEKVIEQGLATFLDVGWALLTIRDGRKYSVAGFATFEEYCEGRWNLKRRHAYRLMDAAETAQTAQLVCPNGHTPAPQSESQVRPLTVLRDEPERVTEAWERAVEMAGGQPTAAQVAEAVEQVRTPQVLHKAAPDGTPPHPAAFSDPLLPVFAELLDGYWRVLDPFAGTGRIHQLDGFDTVGVEIEPEWANLHPATIVGSALSLPFDDDEFDAICTSPTYGNRLADHHNAYDPEARRSYTHDLGRPLHEDNSGAMQWGGRYRAFHEDAWAEAVRVLRPGGRFVLNIKDHIRDGEWQDVAGWHVAALCALGLGVVAIRPVVTQHLRQGANAELRVGAELVIVFDKDDDA